MLQKFDERNRDLIVNVSGRLVPRGEAGVSPFDSVVQGGDAVWEGLRLYRGRIFRLEQHLDRLVNSAKALAFEAIPARDSIVNEIRRTLEANRMFDGVHIRLTLTRGVKITSGMDPRLNQSGPTLIVLAEHKAPVYATGRPQPGHEQRPSLPARLPGSEDPSQQPDPVDPRQDRGERRGSRRRADARHPRFRGGDERDACLRRAAWSPADAATRRLPEGITRQAVIDLCQAHGIACEECDLTQAEVYRADEVFCSGTMGELAAVTRVDGRTIGNGQPGPLTARLSGLFRDLTGSEGTVIVEAAGP